MACYFVYTTLRRRPGQAADIINISVDQQSRELLCYVVIFQYVLFIIASDRLFAGVLKASVDMNDAVITDMSTQVADSDKLKLMECEDDVVDVDVNTIKSQLHSQQV